MANEAPKVGEAQPDWKQKLKPTDTGWERIAGALLVVLGAILWATRVWPFNATIPVLPARPSLAQIVLYDRITLGLVRFGIVFAAAYIAWSVPALVVAGRWLRGFGGVSVDDAKKAAKTIRDQTETINQLRKERDEAFSERDKAQTLVRALLEKAREAP